MKLYHATTQKKAKQYRQSGAIHAPVRGFTTMQARGDQVEIGISTPRWRVPADVESFNEAFDRRYELDDAAKGANAVLSRPAAGD